jgi:hypothetical protein
MLRAEHLAQSSRELALCGPARRATGRHIDHAVATRGQPPQQGRELLVHHRAPGDLNHVEVCQTASKVGQVAARKLEVRPSVP